MNQKFYVVNAGSLGRPFRPGNFNRGTHIMLSRSPSTPNPMSAGNVISNIITGFSQNAKTTLCGLPVTRYVDIFDPSEVSCRECKRRWQQSQFKPDDVRALQQSMADVREAFDTFKIAVEQQRAEREQQVADIMNMLEAQARELTPEAQKNGLTGITVDGDAHYAIVRWVCDPIPDEDRTTDVVYDPKTNSACIVCGIRNKPGYRLQDYLMIRNMS